jgi:hypothetical protein
MNIDNEISVRVGTELMSGARMITSSDVNTQSFPELTDDGYSSSTSTSSCSSCSSSSTS